MALALRSGGLRREWFTDARDSGRRMELSWHRDEGIVIVSLWQGSVCRATFRMPVADAPLAIGVLAEVLGDAATGRPPPAAPRLGRTVGPVTERLRAWLSSHRAKIIEFGPRIEEP